MGNTGCIWALASLYIAADMGFERDLPKALELARMGMRLHDESCCYMIVYIQEKEELASTLPEELRLSKEELLMIKFIGLRYGDQEMLDEVIGNRSYFEKMGYGEEIERYWLPKWERENDLVDDDSTTPAEPVVVKPVVKQKTEIVPTVLVIQPSGFTDFVEADIYSMSFRQMADLIDAEGVDAVHFSTPLNQITKSCGLKRQLTMYVDREGVMKGLEENPAATLLYGDSFPIRGAVIIAMEDRRYDTYSFDTEEDIEEVFEAIFDLTGGRLMRDIGQEDGRYDPWA